MQLPATGVQRLFEQFKLYTLLLFPKSAQVVHFETRATLVTNEEIGRVGTTRQTRPFLKEGNRHRLYFLDESQGKI